MDVNDLLEADASGGWVTVAARVALSQFYPNGEYPLYLAALDKALKEEPPPFDTKVYADIYREVSEDAHWLAVSLITNAEREGDGSKRLWSLAACADNVEHQQLLKSHAVDESGHALLYLLLLDLTFPGVAEPAFRLELEKVSPRYSLGQKLFAVEGSPYAKNPTIDDFLQMNIAEIRTTIHHLMQRSAIVKHCPQENLSRIATIQDSLLRDELKHVAYTAVLLERMGSEIDFNQVSDLFIQRFRDFNQITREDLGKNALY